MHDLQTLLDEGYKDAGLNELRLACPLEEFPKQIFELGGTLQILDLSGTGLSSLPADFGLSLPRLKEAVFAKCNFTTFPSELASCSSLENVDFSNNGMTEIPEEALPPRVCRLILTNNRLAYLPSSTGLCPNLRVCLCTGNQLRKLPSQMANCKSLSVLRLSSNRLRTVPDWVFTLPELAFFSFAGNPCVTPLTNGNTGAYSKVIASTDVEIHSTLHSSPSCTVSRALWHQTENFAEDIAVKIFRQPLTDNGTIDEEVAALCMAGAHESFITGLGHLEGHPDTEAVPAGLVMQLVSEAYRPLNQYVPSGAQPQLQEESATGLTPLSTMKMLFGLAGALSHLHKRGILHGDVVLENILASREDEHALLTNFRAATRFGKATDMKYRLESIEALAFGQLIDQMIRLLGGGDFGQEGNRLKRVLVDLCTRCMTRAVRSRPTFAEIEEEIEATVGWRAMMRVPGA